MNAVLDQAFFHNVGKTSSESLSALAPCSEAAVPDLAFASIPRVSLLCTENLPKGCLENSADQSALLWDALALDICLDKGLLDGEAHFKGHESLNLLKSDFSSQFATVDVDEGAADFCDLSMLDAATYLMDCGLYSEEIPFTRGCGVVRVASRHFVWSPDFLNRTDLSLRAKKAALRRLFSLRWFVSLFDFPVRSILKKSATSEIDLDDAERFYVGSSLGLALFQDMSQGEWMEYQGEWDDSHDDADECNDLQNPLADRWMSHPSDSPLALGQAGFAFLGVDGSGVGDLEFLKALRRSYPLSSRSPQWFEDSVNVYYLSDDPAIHSSVHPEIALDQMDAFHFSEGLNVQLSCLAGQHTLQGLVDDACHQINQMNEGGEVAPVCFCWAFNDAQSYNQAVSHAQAALECLSNLLGFGK